MRHVIIALALATSPVSADETTRPEAQDEQNAPTNCARLADYAATIMEIRQKGASLKDGLTLTGDPDNPFHDIARMIVLDAWEQPRYGTESIQQDAIGDFRDKWHLSCIRANE